ncbi:MAG: hypothetical protein ONB31_15985, partial [candidate division KSB1 bacterium]|nr:hypothetical protein [candidate division KSB1 bacterium]
MELKRGGVQMNHVVINEVDSGKEGADNSNNDSQISNGSAPFTERFEALKIDQNIPTEQSSQLEPAMKAELANFRQIIQHFELQLEQIHQQIQSIERSSPVEIANLEQLSQKIAEQDLQIVQLQNQWNSLAAQRAISPEKLREELITGIRMLGERVSKAIAEMNNRMDQFTKEIREKLDQRSPEPNQATSDLPEEGNDEFAALKESKLLDVNDFEIVPREAIQRLTELFKKQSVAVKNHIGKHEERIREFEKILKVFDEENTRLLDLLNRRIKRNLMICLALVLMIVF